MTTRTVTNGNDNGPGSLRYIISQAAKGDTIVFDPAVNIVTLTSGQILLNSKNITITGNGAINTSIQTNNSSRIFQISNRVAININKITLKGGKADTGGAVFVTGSATVTLNGVAIQDNIATSIGGGLHFSNSNANIYNSTISNNTAKRTSSQTGGGIYTFNSNVKLFNCTVCNNTAGGSGGGIAENDGDLVIINSTICNNNSGGFGGGIRNSYGRLTIGNTIVANNTAFGYGNDIHNNNSIPINSLGHNLIKSPFGAGTLNTTDIINVDPNLKPLGNYGGDTNTMEPIVPSPVINSGDNSLVSLYLNANNIFTDQRGLPRTVNNTVDIGSVEYQ